MKKFKRFIFLLLLFTIVSALLSVLIVRRTSDTVAKGFAFGAPNSQMTTAADGTYSVNYYGYPSTYRVQETFKPTGDIFNESTYEKLPFNLFYVLSNFIFWMGLFMALLSPLTIFYRPKKKLREPAPAESQMQPTEAETPSQVK